mmetsp:Transcript_29681/g.96679  ORF Transcript_29681/g.96679 Transcript_29681/m.96679 type:complete len:298 (+) Transcript_29681:2770-3663(+)
MAQKVPCPIAATLQCWSGASPLDTQPGSLAQEPRQGGQHPSSTRLPSAFSKRPLRQRSNPRRLERAIPPVALARRKGCGAATAMQSIRPPVSASSHPLQACPLPTLRAPSPAPKAAVVHQFRVMARPHLCVECSTLEALLASLAMLCPCPPPQYPSVRLSQAAHNRTSDRAQQPLQRQPLPPPPPAVENASAARPLEGKACCTPRYPPDALVLDLCSAQSSVSGPPQCPSEVSRSPPVPLLFVPFDPFSNSTRPSSHLLSSLALPLISLQLSLARLKRRARLDSRAERIPAQCPSSK